MTKYVPEKTLKLIKSKKPASSILMYFMLHRQATVHYKRRRNIEKLKPEIFKTATPQKNVLLNTVIGRECIE